MTVLVHNYRDAVRLISNAALMAAELGGESHDDALNRACDIHIESMNEALTRTGWFKYETTSDEIEDFKFLGTVAHDILDGDIVRPSTGNVREAALYRMSLSSDERAAFDSR